MGFNTFGTKRLLGVCASLNLFSLILGTMMIMWILRCGGGDDDIDSVRNHQTEVKKKEAKSNWERWHTKSLSALIKLVNTE